MEFAVRIPLDAPDRARWVLDVDPVGERLLLTGEDRTLYWVPMADCEFAKAASPDQPRAVVPIQPQQQSQLRPVTLAPGNHR